MTDGKIASLLFGIREPTEVILTYHEQEKTITLRDSTIVTSNNEHQEAIIPFKSDTFTLHPYENDQLFGWE
jgi:UDP-N-acetylglucosamine pyrophosphorylase